MKLILIISQHKLSKSTSLTNLESRTSRATTSRKYRCSCKSYGNFWVERLGNGKRMRLADESARSKSGRPILENSKRLRQLKKLLLNVISLLVLVESDLRETKGGLEHLKMLKKLTKLSLKGKTCFFWQRKSWPLQRGVSSL